MDCLFSRDSFDHLSNKVGNHISPLKGVFLVMMTLVLTLSNGTETWAYPGCTIQGACNYDPDATTNDGSCDFVSCLAFGCTNATACNYDPDADYNDNSCEYVSCAGCMNEAACDYDPDATLAATCTDFSSCYGCTDGSAPNYDPTATLDDGSCEVPGCTIVGACNFDPNANVDDNSCDFFSCLPSGCLNQNACNYDPSAVINDGSCVFADAGYDCDGNCLADTDGDGVCDANEIEGCTDSSALNFDEDATDDDGSCISSTPGCLDPTACNYNPLANQSDDSCEFTSCAGCLSPSACNYDATAVYPATCEFPDAGYDCDGNCLIDNDGDGVCDQFEIAGCTDETACNYDSEATELDGSCDFSTCAGCTNEFGCNYDPNATIDDGSCDFFSCITFGCTNSTACNYDAEATYEDGSCEFVSCAGCTNPAACDYDPDATISAQCQDFTSCLGCTDPEADNYDPAATQDSGNCLFLGCTVAVACNYDANANSDDGSCEYESCAGCLNPIACNYDPDAILSGTCEFADNGYDCDGNCLEDTDGDGICDPFEVLGCTNPDAVNFDSDATDDDGSCFILTEGCIDPSACNYDETANTDDGSCEFTSCAGCLNESACNYDPTAIYPAECEFPEYAYNCDGTCIADNDGDGICNPFEVPGCTAEDACNYDPEATDDDGSCDFITCNVPGCTNPFACNYDPEAVINDGSCDFLSCLAFGCTNPSACNYDPDANYNDGSCEYTTCAGCTNPLACDFDPDATIAAGCNDYSSCYGCTDELAANFDENATFDDGSCQFPGCTVEGACNYDESANFNDGSCDFFSCLVEGCLNETACNYDPDADLPGECEYPEAGYDCDGNCLEDADGDGVCDQFEIAGCTDETALNFDSEATEDNGSCILPVEGCTDSAACNYDITANTDDGSCEFDSCVGCLAPTACNYNADAIYPGECEYPDLGYDCDGNCLSDFDGDGVCDPFEVLGCDDPAALNYDPNATQDDGSCIDIVEGCTNADACNYNPDANVDDESCDFESCIGCLSPEACNYDPDATVAGECVFPELGYDCDGVCLEDADGDGVCDPFEIAGCTDPEACNYDEDATDDNGSCFTALDGYDCDGNCLSDQDNDGICDPFELPPLLFVPADTLAECGSDLPVATATGGCSEPIVTFEDEVLPGNCEGNFTTLRTWTATDNCGNSSSRVQTILFQDTTAPELTIPADYTAECSDDLVLDDASAIDACSSFEISETSVTTPGDAAGNYVIVRTFTATDDCGNSSSASQTITVEDTTAPEFTFVPADYTVECSDEMPMDDATASDNCGEVTIEVSSETTAGDAAGNYVIVRTFTATDDAGNSSSATQTITVQDTTAPEFTFVPADYTVECSDEMPMDDATASDNCGEVTIEVSSETTAGDAAGNYVIVRTFTATDDAGNSSSASQTITVQDTTAPEFTFVPADYTVECSDEMPMDDATASDNCGEVTIEVSSETTAGDAAGNYVIVRTFTATDDAGNSSSASQTITVQDTTAPEFTFVPADYTVECSDEMPMDDATASDNCGEVTIEVSSETTAGDAAGNYVIVRTFTATDDAGNSSSASQTITVQDTTAPEFTFVPADYTVECSDEMPMDDATASDNCGEVTIEVSSETTAGDAAGNYVIVRTFTATDDAGNSSSATQTITVQDTTAPEFTFVPADYTVECSDEMPMDDATASDNCGEVTIEVSSETTAGDAAGNYVIVRTFTATDDAGNSSSATQTITVQDTTAPEFTFVPADYTVECSDEMPMDDATASDNCGEVTIEVSSETTAGDAAGNYVIVRTFTATDDAGNSSSATQTITVQDTTAPEFTFVPADYTVECSDEMPMDDATASDNCGEVTIEVSSETTAGDAAGNYVIVRTFTATDDAGNSSSASQTITVEDTTAPEFTFVPADYTVECSDEMPMDDATASDNCGEVTIEVSSETTAGDAAGNYVIVRTFTATDDAGNSSSASQTITVQDTTAPEFTFVPADYTVECSDEMPMDDATASDNCGEVTIEVSSETTAGDAAGNYVIVRTFTATDDAGNSSSATQTITVQDTTAPEFTFVPADYTVECSDEMPMDDATASDNCGEVTIEVSSETTAGDAAGNYVIVRTFTATDDAGNSSSATQTITVQDTTAPEFTFVPADYTVECSDEMPMDDATASDNCGEVTIEVSSETTAGDAAGNYVIVRTFTATDDAGNSSSASQTITVQDTTAPEFTFVPADYTVECSDEMPMDDATASDNCGEVTIEVSSETTAGDAAGNYVIVRTFTATDDAGNSSSASQTITVEDTTAPEFTFVPADYTVECSDEMPMDDATASDNCGEVTIEVSSETTAGDAAGNYVIVRTFTATDDAGNSSSASQTITVQDTTAPEFTFVPADYTVECSDEMPMDDATASDNCGEVTIEVSSETTAGDAAGNYVIVRTFTATDDAGNSSSATQTITVQDTTAPEFTFVPADYTVECSDEMPMDDATASDNCGEVTIEVSSETTAGDAAGNYVIVRTFTATDDAGNSSSASQTITVQDTTAPEFTFVPADYTVECSDEMPMDDATASDNCGEVTIEVSSETTAGDAAGNYVIVRTFTATDDAGNSSSATQTITVQDTTAPEFTFVPADYTVECSDEMPMDDATASDNCGEVTIEVSSETTAGDAAGNYVIVRTFTATDDAGNSSSASQTITVQDTTAPEFTFVPADYTVECSDEMPMDDATASDNCGEVTIEVSSETTAGDAAGNYVIVRTFTATDDAGNSSSASQTITVQDTTAPEFTFVPADYTVECSDEMPMDDATASDNCGEVTIEVSSETTAGDAAGNYVIVRTFTATDDAGNSSSASQTITVQDTTAPEFTFVPADYTVECSDEMPMDDATASDNCGEVTIEVSSETTAGDAAGNYVIVRTFTATDDAGNSSSATQTITVQDTTAPEFTFVPADYTVECSDEMPMDDATASDNCGEVTIEVSSETTAGDAAGNYVIVRTFTATDDAGNSSSATQTITVQDTTAPEFTFVPADYTVECSDEMPMDDATASDNCGEVTIEVSSETTAGDAAGNYVIVRTFTATDDAGNSATASQTITVQDTTAPEFTFVPADYTVECSDEMPMDDATASDNCGEVTIEVSSETTAGDAAGNYVIVRTFTATDDAGNSATASQTITVQDTTAPEFTFVPADYTVECSDEMPMDDATASDNCGEVTIEVSSETTAGDAAGNYVIVRTFTATDDAGNSSSATQTITVQDTTAPEFTFVPADYTVECSDEMPMDDATASDNCGEVTIEVSSETTAGDAAGNYVIVRTFTATDDAGNSSSATQTITVQDTTAPEFTFVPEGFAVSCSSELPAEYDMATAADNCGEVSVALTFAEVPGDVDGAYTLVLTYTATDDAGNSNTAEVEIEVGDTVPEGDCDCDGNQLDAIGVCGGDCLADSDGDGICDLFEAFGCDDETACNYDPEATQNDGSCTYPETGYDCDGECLEDANENGICDIFEVSGCTDETNPGYNPFATIDDGSCLVGGCLIPSACNYTPDADYQILGFCDFSSCTGCTDAEACNYDEDATVDDGSCEFAGSGLDCDGVCLNDADGDGVCDEDEVGGCTDITNPGYNPFATEDDGSCLVGGCVLPFACNYDANAEFLIFEDCDFTSCTGCTDEDSLQLRRRCHP